MRAKNRQFELSLNSVSSPDENHTNPFRRSTTGDASVQTLMKLGLNLLIETFRYAKYPQLSLLYCDPQTILHNLIYDASPL